MSMENIDWGKLRHWQVFDPIPWWILDEERLQQILVAQLDFQIRVMEQQVKQMHRIREIVAG